MQIVFSHYAAAEVIPVQACLKDRKIAKYFNRETAAAIVAAHQLLSGRHFSKDMPFYYETGEIECEGLGLEEIAAASVDSNQRFSAQIFAEQGVKAVPPLTQFKALYNMPLSFVAIEHGLTGDNAVIYASASALLLQARLAPVDQNILLGCGKLFADGSTQSAFALVDKAELEHNSFLHGTDEAIHMFRAWHRACGAQK